MSSEFDGLVAIVTGGGSGIGAAIVQELLSRGAKVAAFDLDPSAVPEGVLAVTADVSDDGSVNRGVQKVVDAGAGSTCS
jgi:NAD(P)-dependent dehydrogenase (short-subunit alcohol dehydrogenase family)